MKKSYPTSVLWVESIEKFQLNKKNQINNSKGSSINSELIAMFVAWLVAETLEKK